MTPERRAVKIWFVWGRASVAFTASGKVCSHQSLSHLRLQRLFTSISAFRKDRRAFLLVSGSVRLTEGLSAVSPVRRREQTGFDTRILQQLLFNTFTCLLHSFVLGTTWSAAAPQRLNPGPVSINTRLLMQSPTLNSNTQLIYYQRWGAFCFLMLCPKVHIWSADSYSDVSQTLQLHVWMWMEIKLLLFIRFFNVKSL